MELDECLCRTRHRVYLAWIKWLNEDWNCPSRSDWYQMQTAAEVRRQYLKDPSSASPDKMLMRFLTQPAAEVKPRSPAETAALSMNYSKSLWAAGLGMGLKKSGKKTRR